jgi:hypothetical protein
MTHQEKNLSTDFLSRTLRFLRVYRWSMKKIVDYLHDFFLERRIRIAVNACKRAQDRNDRSSVLAHWDDMCRLIHQRSPSAIKRMERRRGLI